MSVQVFVIRMDVISIPLKQKY